MHKKTLEDNREFDCDKEQDEDLFGFCPSVGFESGERLIEAIINQALEDCAVLKYRIVKGTKILAPEIIDAWNWLMDNKEDNWNIPFTFEWCCKEIGFSAERWRTLLQERRRYVANAIALTKGAA